MTEDLAPPLDPDHYETGWVKVSEWLDGDGDAYYAMSHSEVMTPAKIIGLLTAALDFHRAMATNMLFGMEFPEDGCEQ